MGNPGKADDRLRRHATATASTTATSTIDTSKQGWALYDSRRQLPRPARLRVAPSRSYQALEFQIDRAWDDKWAFNASYVLSVSKRAMPKAR